MIKCRSCYSDKLYSIIPLGEMPLANALTDSPEPNCKRYNLEVMLCESCGLAQLRDLVDPKELFSNYVYFSSNSDTMLKSARDLVNKTLQDLPQDAHVIEIASNDGYLVKNYVNNNIQVLGIDPAQNIAEAANKRGIKTICDFFSHKLAQTLRDQGKLADIIHANNVMAHIPDINDFIQGLKTLLKPQGKIIIEVPYFLDLVQKFEFDTIYHEHIYYFALKPLVESFKRHGLNVYTLEKLLIHGGTLRLYVGHEGERSEDPIIQDTLRKEEEFGLFKPETYVIFMKNLEKLKENLSLRLRTLKNSGNKIAAYGASAKGTTLLNYFNIGHYLDFIVDKSLQKQSKFTPGTAIKVNAPDSLLKENVSYALLLAWNLAEEIIEQQKEFIQKGGKFILPLPEVIEVS